MPYRCIRDIKCKNLMWTDIDSNEAAIACSGATHTGSTVPMYTNQGVDNLLRGGSS